MVHAMRNEVGNKRRRAKHRGNKQTQSERTYEAVGADTLTDSCLVVHIHIVVVVEITLYRAHLAVVVELVSVHILRLLNRMLLDIF